MASKQMPIRLTDEERELIDKLAFLIGEETNEKIEATTAVRVAIKEALSKRNVELADGVFEKKPEGRPKETASLVTTASNAILAA